MLRKFKIFIHGKNYLLKEQGAAARKHGFYVTVFVEARNHEEAEALALEVLKKDRKILGVCENSDTDAPTLLVERTDEIASFGNCKLPRTGLVLYPEELER